MEIETQACPKCGDWVERDKPGQVAITMFLLGFVALWVPVIGWIAAPFMFLFGGLGCLAAAMPTKTFSFDCPACKKSFKVAKCDMVTT